MPRNGSGVYSLPTGSIVSNGDDILPAQHNDPLNDLAADANAIRPVAAGGTGASSSAGARTALGVPPIANPTFTGTATAPRARLTSTSSVTLTSTDHALQIGPTSGPNIAADRNEIQSRNNGTASELYLNLDGGSVDIGSATEPSLLTARGGLKSLGVGTFEGAAAYVFSNDTNATVSGSKSTALRFQANGTETGHVGFLGSTNFRLRADQANVLIHADNDNTDSGTFIQLSVGGSEVGRLTRDEFQVSAVRATNTADVSLSSTGHGFQIGSSAGANIAADGNKIQARDNGAASQLSLNTSGGDIVMSAAGSNTDVRGTMSVDGNRVVTTERNVIGSLVFALQASGAPVLYGDTISGAEIRPGGTASGVNVAGDTLPGTWQCLGQSRIGIFTMWQRIS